MIILEDKIIFIIFKDYYLIIISIQLNQLFNKFCIISMEKILISSIGWIYFSAWSVAFYGQIYTNYKLKRYYLLIILV